MKQNEPFTIHGWILLTQNGLKVNLRTDDVVEVLQFGKTGCTVITTHNSVNVDQDPIDVVMTVATWQASPRERLVASPAVVYRDANQNAPSATDGAKASNLQTGNHD